ncbi:hypothetical protein [uncultured Microbulbifer sp.]|nr:hypothetical protein [uncultured Microbulbifer sp.]
MRKEFSSWWNTTSSSEKSALLTLAVIATGIGIFALGIKLGAIFGRLFG